MSKLNLGYCGIDETPIWSVINNRAVPNEDYSEFWISIDDDTIAKHAICKSCSMSLTDQKVVNVFERIRETWLNEMVGWGTDADFERVRHKTVLTWGLSESAVYDNVINYAALES